MLDWVLKGRAGMEGPKRKVAGTEQQEEGKRGDQEGPWEKGQGLVFPLWRRVHVPFERVCSDIRPYKDTGKFIPLSCITDSVLKWYCNLETHWWASFPHLSAYIGTRLYYIGCFGGHRVIPEKTSVLYNAFFSMVDIWFP